MFEFDDMEEKQKEIKEKLAALRIEGVAEGGAVKVTVNGDREIISIDIDKEKVDPTDLEQLEDLIIIAANRALSVAADKEAEVAQTMLKNMLPPGLSDLFDD